MASLSSAKKRMLLCIAGIPLLLGLAACGGGNSTSSTVTAGSITISPTTLSLSEGDVASVSAQVLNTSGNALSPQPVITYSTSDPTAVTVSPSGSVCGGVWDSSYVVCNRGNIPSGTVQIHASADGVSTSADVSIHLRIDRVQLSTPAVTCVSQGQEAQYTAKSYSNNIDVTDTAGTVTWKLSDTGIADINSSGLVIAKTPGITNVYATVGNTTSSPLAFVACSPASIHLEQADTRDTTLSMQKGDTVSLVATVTDVLGNPIKGAPLTFTSSQPALGRVTSNGVVTADLTAVSAGDFDVVASCTPPKCNNAPTGVVYTSTGQVDASTLGFNYPVYSNPVSGAIDGKSATTVYVTGQSYFDGLANHQLQIFDSETLTLQSTVPLPNVANSMMFNPAGTTAFIGSDDGLMQFDPNTNTATVFSGTISGLPNVDTVAGHVLAVSPDGTKVIVSDVTDGHVFVVDTGANTATVYNAPGVRAAQFTPDGYKALLSGDSGLYDYVSLLHQVSTISLTNNTGLTILPEGTVAFASGANVSAIATCNDQVIGHFGGTVGPLTSMLTSTGTRVIGISDSAWTDLGVTLDGSACPTAVSVKTSTAAYSGCSPTEITPAPDGSAVYVSGVSSQGCSGADVRSYHLSSSTTSSLSIQGGGIPMAGAIIPDGSKLYVGVLNNGTAALHLIDLTTGTDTTQVDLPFEPDVVAVWPK